MNLRITNSSEAYSGGGQALKNVTLTISNGVYGLLKFNGRSVPLCFFLPVMSGVIALLVGAPVYAQDKISEIDKIFSWATPATPGCVCAVSQHGKPVASRAYGSADLEREVSLSPGAIFDAGSLQKQFVAAAILLLVEEGRVSLSDDIRNYIPQLPDYGHKITVDHLLTHTSGIRDWTGLLPLAGGNADALTMILRQRGLNFAPGEEFSYSNSGYVLLKEIVARTSGTSFAEFTRKRLFEPLGMKTTLYLVDMRDVIKNRALPYDKEGNRWKMAMLLDNARGGGGLLSTAGDLLIWNDALTNNRLGAFVSEKIQEPARLNNGRKLGYARGLFLDSTNRGRRVIWHTGSADGYKSFLGRFPEEGLSIAIMCNSGDGTDRLMFASRIFDLLVPAKDTPEAATKSQTTIADSSGVAGLNLNSRTGLFFSEHTGEPLRLIVDNSRLRIAGGPVLVPATRERFRNPSGTLNFMSDDEFELNFLSPDQFELKSMEGKKIRYRRAQAYAPTSTDLQAFAGRYENDEIGTVFQVEPGKEGLMVRLNDSPDKTLEIRPVDRETFQYSRITVRFQRDKTGKVVAFDFSNPLLRNIKFTRTK